MLELTVSLILDVIIALLLVATIFYAVTLNRRLQTIRESRQELEQLTKKFIDATAQAETSIQNLKTVSGEAGQTLQHKIDEAKKLDDDLSFLVKRGDDLADRLADSISNRRQDLAEGSGAMANLQELAKSATPKATKAKPAAVSNEKVLGTKDPSANDEEKEKAAEELKKALKGLR